MLETTRTGLSDHTFPLNEFATSSASELLDDVNKIDLNETEVNDLLDNVVKFVLQQDEDDKAIPAASSFMIPMNALQDNTGPPTEQNTCTWPLLKNVLSTVVEVMRDQPSQNAVYSAIFNCMSSVYQRRTPPVMGESTIVCRDGVDRLLIAKDKG